MLLPLILFAQTVLTVGAPCTVPAKIPAKGYVCPTVKITIPAAIPGPQGVPGPAGPAGVAACPATAPCTLILTNPNYVSGQPFPLTGWQMVITLASPPTASVEVPKLPWGSIPMEVGKQFCGDSVYGPGGLAACPATTGTRVTP